VLDLHPASHPAEHAQLVEQRRIGRHPARRVTDGRDPGLQVYSSTSTLLAGPTKGIYCDAYLEYSRR
jgi:hypothetical protein